MSEKTKLLSGGGRARPISLQKSATPTVDGDGVIVFGRCDGDKSLSCKMRGYDVHFIFFVHI